MTNIKKIYTISIILHLVTFMKAKSLGEDRNYLSYNRNKRGFGKYGQNDYGSSIQVSSGVLQYGAHDDDLSAAAQVQYSTNNDWKPSQPLVNSEVWLEPSQSYPELSQSHDTSLSPPPATHSGSVHIANGVFSSDAQSSHAVSPNQHPELHTQIFSSSGISSGIGNGGDIDIGHHHAAALGVGGVENISDNIDFSNFVDMGGKHYAKSYGK